MACEFPTKMLKTGGEKLPDSSKAFNPSDLLRIKYTIFADLDVYVGEWSLGITDCQKYLHGGYSDTYSPPDATEAACQFYNSKFGSYSK